MNTPRLVSGYSLDALSELNPLPIIAKRAPGAADTGYILGQLWIFSTSNLAYILTSVANGAASWLLLQSSGASGTFTALTVTVGPSALNGNLSVGGTILGTSTITAATNLVASNGNLILDTAGNKLVIATGANASVGTSAAMIAGTITIDTTAVTASSIIFLSAHTPGGTQGVLSVGTVVAATSFVINSSSDLDTSTVNWLIIN